MKPIDWAAIKETWGIGDAETAKRGIRKREPPKWLLWLCRKRKVFAVGKVKILDSQGTGRLLLYGLYRKKADAERYVKDYRERYYKTRPYLCPMEIKEMTV